MKCLLQFIEVFEPVGGVDGEIKQARLSEKLKSVEERTAALQALFLHLRHQRAFPCLKGWRDEVPEIFRVCVQQIKTGCVT